MIKLRDYIESLNFHDKKDVVMNTLVVDDDIYVVNYNTGSRITINHKIPFKEGS